MARIFLDRPKSDAANAAIDRCTGSLSRTKAASTKANEQSFTDLKNIGSLLGTKTEFHALNETSPAPASYASVLSSLSKVYPGFGLEVSVSQTPSGVLRLQAGQWGDFLPADLSAALLQEISEPRCEVQAPAVLTHHLGPKSMGVLIAALGHFEGYSEREHFDVLNALKQGRLPKDESVFDPAMGIALLAMLQRDVAVTFRPAKDRAAYDAIATEASENKEPAVIFYTDDSVAQGTNQASIIRRALWHCLLNDLNVDFSSFGIENPGTLFNRLERLYGQAKNWSMVRHDQAYWALTHASKILAAKEIDPDSHFRVVNIDSHTDLQLEAPVLLPDGRPGVGLDPDNVVQRRGEEYISAKPRHKTWSQQSMLHQHQIKDMVYWTSGDMALYLLAYVFRDDEITADWLPTQKIYTGYNFPKTTVFAIHRQGGKAHALINAEELITKGHFPDSDYRLVPFHKVSEAADWTIETWDRKLEALRERVEIPENVTAQSLYERVRNEFHSPSFLSNDDAPLMMSTDLDVMSSNDSIVSFNSGNGLLSILDAMLDAKLDPFLNAHCLSPKYLKRDDKLSVRMIQSMFQIYSSNRTMHAASTQSDYPTALQEEAVHYEVSDMQRRIEYAYNENVVRDLGLLFWGQCDDVGPKGWVDENGHQHKVTLSRIPAFYDYSMMPKEHWAFASDLAQLGLEIFGLEWLALGTSELEARRSDDVVPQPDMGRDPSPLYRLLALREPGSKDDIFWQTSGESLTAYHDWSANKVAISHDNIREILEAAATEIAEIRGQT